MPEKTAYERAKDRGDGDYLAEAYRIILDRDDLDPEEKEEKLGEKMQEAIEAGEGAQAESMMGLTSRIEGREKGQFTHY